MCPVIVQASESVSSEDVAGRGRGRFEREASMFGSFRQEWTLKLAKAMAAAFEKASKQYRLNLDAFAGSNEGWGSLRLREIHNVLWLILGPVAGICSRHLSCLRSALLTRSLKLSLPWASGLGNDPVC